MSTWPHSGDWGELRVDELPEILVALCTAVNEREDARHVDSSTTPTYTEWWFDNTGGDKDSFPDATSFEGLPLFDYTTSISPWLLHNLVTLNEVIDEAKGFYVDGTDSTTGVDYSSVTTAWGAFSSDPPESWQDHRYWCRARDTLKLMRYFRYSFAASSYDYFTIREGYNGYDEPPTPPDFDYSGDLAWWQHYNHGIDSTTKPSYVGGFNNGVFYSHVEIPPPPDHYAVKTYESQSTSRIFEFSKIDTSVNGNITKAMSYITKRSFYCDLTVASSDGNSYSVTGDTTETLVEEDYTEWVSTSDKTLTFTADNWDTSSNPCQTPADYQPYEERNQGGAYIIPPGSIIIWFDQASVITDL